jgi:hypothetical protein
MHIGKRETTMITADGTINLAARPASPGGHTSTRNNMRLWRGDWRPVPLNYDVPMDWHHIIPWNTLRDGWSALCGSGRWEVIAEWLNLMDVADGRTRISEMRNNALAMPHTQDMHTRLCWSKWNLVEGPTNGNRTDDPGGDDVDSFSGLKTSNGLRDRSQMLSLIFHVMRNWDSTLTNLTQADTRALLSYFVRLRPYKRTPIHLFDDKTWVLVDAGKIDRFGLAIHNKHPTWRKA